MPYFEVTYTDGTVDEIEADECTPRLWEPVPVGSRAVVTVDTPARVLPCRLGVGGPAHSGGTVC
jgi:hypothetical protein